MLRNQVESKNVINHKNFLMWFEPKKTPIREETGEKNKDMLKLPQLSFLKNFKHEKHHLMDK
jgi:hypothetical protein